MSIDKSLVGFCGSQCHNRIINMRKQCEQRTICPFMPLLLLHDGIQSNSWDQHFSRQTHKTKGIEKKKIMERINCWVWFNDSIKRDLRINDTLSNK
jgi:hypothetical protein